MEYQHLTQASFRRCLRVWILALTLWPLAGAVASQTAGPRISWMRTPGGGIQPQATVDSEGRVHLIYFKGEPAAGDLFYVRREAGEQQFSVPLRVNSHPGSVVAMGTIRGGQLAVGKGGRAHVVWNGSKQAQPRGSDSDHDTPMLYTRLDDSGGAFEPQRNLIQHAYGLDGGGSVAADVRGNVYVAWHANPAADGEARRRVYLATSGDGGKSFAPEVPISPRGTGVCGCCGMKAFADSRGHLVVLYRSATEQVDRDIYLLTSKDHGRTFRSHIVDEWQIARCPMSSATFAEGPAGIVAGWETAERVLFGRIDSDAGMVVERMTPPGPRTARKHPAAAINANGEMLVVWTEGTGWNRGGAVGWQAYDSDGNATEVRGTRDGVPNWSLATVFAEPDGSFTIVY